MGDLFFLASKTLGMAARAETWLLAMAMLAVVAAWRGRMRAARLWVTLTFASLAALTLWPLGDLLLRPLEGRYPANPPLDRVDGIIVLGGAEDIDAMRRWGQPALNEGAERVIAGAELARRYPEARLIYTGGTGALNDTGSARDPSTIVTGIWAGLGVPQAQITVEAASRNTSENARFTHEIVRPRPGQVYLLITSAFHMPRSMEAFGRAGWPGLVAWPVDFRSGGLEAGPGWQLGQHLADLDLALKEYLGLLIYRLAGK
jgi:uncharacterized SAM-binding protein YcdF (DUF218 family)